MKCIFTKGELFKSIIDAVKDLTPEANIDFTIDGVEMQAMDASHVSLCSLQLRMNLFKTYSCTENISLGINLKTLSMVLNGAKGELAMASDGDKLQLEVNKLNGKASYVLNLMDIDSEALGLPDMVYNTISAMPSSTFSKVIKDLGNFSDACEIEITDHLRISVKGDAGNVDWHSGEECRCSIQGDSKPLQFGLRYMACFSKGASVSPKVILNMSPDVPICITYPIEEHGYLKFYLAPKMED